MNNYQVVKDFLESVRRIYSLNMGIIQSNLNRLTFLVAIEGYILINTRDIWELIIGPKFFHAHRLNIFLLVGPIVISVFLAIAGHIYYGSWVSTENQYFLNFVSSLEQQMSLEIAEEADGDLYNELVILDGQLGDDLNQESIFPVVNTLKELRITNLTAQNAAHRIFTASYIAMVITIFWIIIAPLFINGNFG